MFFSLMEFFISIFIIALLFGFGAYVCTIFVYKLIWKYEEIKYKVNTTQENTDTNTSDNDTSDTIN